MTTPKEALELAKPLIDIMASNSAAGSFEAKRAIDAALASLQGEDAVERVAHAVTSEFGRMYKDGVPMCMREGETTWRTYHAGFDLSMFANRIVNAILASGLVTAADEAFIRAEQAGRALASVHAGLELLLAAVNADDPKREILVRIGDLMRDAQPARAFVAQPIVKAAKVATAETIERCAEVAEGMARNHGWNYHLPSVGAEIAAAIRQLAKEDHHAKAE